LKAGIGHRALGIFRHRRDAFSEGLEIFSFSMPDARFQDA
jgi:hypothetical protein